MYVVSIKLSVFIFFDIIQSLFDIFCISSITLVVSLKMIFDVLPKKGVV
jgi:hypothetical protein